MTRRAARRRRWKLAIGLVAVGGLVVAWWLRTGGELPPLDLHATAPPAPVTLTAPVVTPEAPAVPIAPVQAPSPATVAAPTQVQIAALDAAHARDEAWAAARRESIRVQQRLRAEAAAERARVNALETDDEIRCIEGRRMRRVSNGWVDAGTC